MANVIQSSDRKILAKCYDVQGMESRGVDVRFGSDDGIEIDEICDVYFAVTEVMLVAIIVVLLDIDCMYLQFGS